METQQETLNEQNTAPVSTTTNNESSKDEEGPIVMRVRKRNGSLEPVDVNKNC